MVIGALMQWAIHFSILDYSGSDKLWLREKSQK
jgi:hypothetical protein